MPFGYMRNPQLLLLLLSVLASTPSHAQKNDPDSRYTLLTGNNFVLSKNYYLLTLFQEIPAVRKLLASDETLACISQQKILLLGQSLKDCKNDVLCYTSILKFSATEISKVSEQLGALYAPGNALGNLMQQHLIPSGAYILFRNLSPKEMLQKAWEQDARGINFAIGVYAEGNPTHYPLIDSISFQVRSTGSRTSDSTRGNIFSNSYASLVYNVASLAAQQSSASDLFFHLSLISALRFLEINEREQAADFEPMTAGENRSAHESIKTVKWSNYPYSVILVPGAGPEEPTVALSAEGMIRCRLAAIQYARGAAPFIVVSGGKVHPYKTKYCEAVEMKRFLREKLNIPEQAIIIEPHARHTTTNLRNTVRIMYRYGIPFDKPGLTCTTRGQSTMIGTTLIDRCLKELNEAPYKNGKRLSETEIEFYPLIEALQLNPEEPMDP